MIYSAAFLKIGAECVILLATLIEKKTKEYKNCKPDPRGGLVLDMVVLVLSGYNPLLWGPKTIIHTE